MINSDISSSNDDGGGDYHELQNRKKSDVRMMLLMVWIGLSHAALVVAIVAIYHSGGVQASLDSVNKLGGIVDGAAPVLRHVIAILDEFCMIAVPAVDPAHAYLCKFNNTLLFDEGMVGSS